MPMVCGGLGEAKLADETVAQVLDKIKDQLLAKIGETLKDSVSSTPADLALVPVHYKTQLVAGTNFFVKVKVGESDFIHARIYRDLEGNVTLHSVSEIKTETDEIVYF